MEAVRLSGVSYVYSIKSPYEKTALKNISFVINKGEFVGIIGQTGSGKSTLLQHLNGLLKAQSGEISVAGLDARDKKNLKQLRYKVGMVFQYPEYQLFEDTLERDVAFGPKNMKLPTEEVALRVKRALELVGLPYLEFASRSPFELSGGEKRRAAIAGVIAMQPEILVLDEPFAGLDPVGRKEILALIKKIKAEVSPTVIMVSHSMDDIAECADRIIALKDGEIAADGTPGKVFGNRKNVREMGLQLPFAAAVVDSLNKKGLNLSLEIVKEKELIGALEKIKDGGNFNV